MNTDASQASGPPGGSQDGRRTSAPSPLFVWKLLLVVVLLAGAFLYYSDPFKIIARQRNDSVSKQLSAIHFSENQTGIIFFGNSLMDSALPLRETTLDQALAAEIQKLGRRTVSVSTVNAAMGGFSAWELKAMGDKLIQSRPDVIVIQSEIIVARHNQDQQKKNLDRIGMWSGLVERRLLGKLPDATRNQARKSKLIGRQLMERQIGEEEKAEFEQQQKEQNLEEAKALWGDATVSDKSPEFLASREFIQRAVSKGIRIIVLELPVSRTASNLASEEYFKQRTAAIHSLVPPEQLLILRYPRVLPDEYFKDFSHLRPRGRREFLGWFLPALAKELR